jgi:DNA-directed RNA polymerase specialized sigma24 family protein
MDTQAGMARTKAQGKRIARAPLPPRTQSRIAHLYQQGMSIAQISKRLRIGYGTAWNYVQQAKRSTSLPCREAPGDR